MIGEESTETNLELKAMGVASKVGDLVFKGFTAALGVTTVYLAGTFSFNVYRGLSWHKAQSKINKEEAEAQSP